MNEWFDAALIVATVAWAGWALLQHRNPELAALLDLIGDVAYVSLLVPCLVRREYGAAQVVVVGIIISWWIRRRRGGRRRASRSLGAKSRARLRAIVERAREAARPRPVLRPLPGGAR